MFRYVYSRKHVDTVQLSIMGGEVITTLILRKSDTIQIFYHFHHNYMRISFRNTHEIIIHCFIIFHLIFVFFFQNLACNNLGPEGARYLKHALRSNCFLLKLNVASEYLTFLVFFCFFFVFFFSYL